MDRLTRMIRRAVTKMACLLGNHTYSPAMLQFTAIDRGDKFGEYRYGTYRVDNDCIWCGKHYCALVKIPWPAEWEAKMDGGDHDAAD